MDKKFIFTDEELISRFQNGDEQAYIELVNRYRDRLMSFVYRFVNDEVVAEDIVQDALVKLYTHKHYYKNIAKFSTWMYTIAGNLAKTELRKNKRRKVTNLSEMGKDDWEYDIPSDEDTEISNASLQALSSEMQQFVTEYQWREKQQAKLQADYEKGLQALG